MRNKIGRQVAMLCVAALGIAGCGGTTERTAPAAAPANLAGQATPAAGLVITNARILDGKGGVIDNGSIVVRDGRIVSVAAGAAEAPGALVIDAAGRTLMPGFIDAHRHVINGDPAEWMANEAAPRMQEFLEAGFTTVLSAGDSLEHILELRRQLQEGQIAGPRLIVSGRVPLARPRAGGPGGGGVDPARIDVSRPPDRPTQTAVAIPEEESREAVRRMKEAGVDAIKTNIIITPNGPETRTLSIVADEARKQGLLPITHAVTVMDTMAAVEAKTSILVHTPHIQQLTPEQAKIVADSGIPMMTTLGIFVPGFGEDNQLMRERTGDDNLPRFRDLDPFPMNTLSSAGQGPVNGRMLFDAGVVYGYGTDVRYRPRDALRHELRPLRLVFSARDIVRIMGANAAVTVGRGADLGSLEAGKIADIVMLNGNPLEDVQHLLDVALVVKDGQVAVDKR